MATNTAVDVVMPQMGVSVSEGTITRWAKQVGDTVDADETLLEISTDKVDTEVPSPASGVISEILVEEGETVEVGTVLARIGGEAPAAAPARRPEPAAAAPEPVAATARAGCAPAACRGRSRPLRRRLQPPPSSGNGRSFVSPVVARIAAEHGIDPSLVSGTGGGGRVTKKDIQAFIEAGGAAAAAPIEAAPRRTGADRAARSGRGGRSAAPPPAAPAPAPTPAAAPPPPPS